MEERQAEALTILLSIVAFLGGWEIIGRAGVINPDFFVPFSQVAVIFPSVVVSTFGQFLVTLREIVLAFVIAAAAGIGTGLLFGSGKLLYQVTHPYLVLALSLPKVILFPIFFLFLGISANTNLLFGAFLGYFPIAVNVSAGVSTVDTRLIDLARSLGASRRQIFTKIILPDVVPITFAGLRFGLILTMFGVIAAELIFPQLGMGSLIIYYTTYFRTAQAYAVIMYVAIAAIALTESWLVLERRLTRWQGPV